MGHSWGDLFSRAPSRLSHGLPPHVYTSLMTSSDIRLGGEALVRNQGLPSQNATLQTILGSLILGVSAQILPPQQPCLKSPVASPHLLSHTSPCSFPLPATINSVACSFFFIYLFQLTCLYPAHPHNGPSELCLAHHGS